MSKYCNRCKKDLEIDNFYSYKKSICKQCINKKVKCDYCNKEFNSTNLSKHIKQMHSTVLRSNKSDSTYNGTYNSTYDDNTLQVSDKNNKPLYPTIEDSLYLKKYNELKKDKIYDIKTRNQISRILTKNRILHNKRINKIITKKEETQFENNSNKLKDLDCFDERVCKILLKYKYFD